MSTYRATHAAIAGAFLLSGLVFGTWAARLPALQSGLGLTDGELALALMALNGGAMVGLQAGAVLVTRLGSRTTLRMALPGFPLLLLPIAAAPTLLLLAAALAAAAAVNSVVDVAINANGIVVERRFGHGVLSRLHAMLTLGGILGAGFSAVAAHLDTGPIVQFATVAAIGTVGGALLTRWLTAEELRPAGQRPQPPARARWLLGYGGIAFCVLLAEGSGNDWTAVYLHDLGTSDAFAAAGVAVFLGAMTAGRLAGDHIRARVDAVSLLRGAGLVAAVGLGSALLLRHPVAGVAGFGLLGLGLSVMLPVILGVVSHRAAQAGLSPAVAVARVSTIAYLGSFAGPALIGVAATAVGLGTALLLSVAACTAAALGARVLVVRPPGPSGPAQSAPSRSAQDIS